MILFVSAAQRNFFDHRLFYRRARRLDELKTLTVPVLIASQTGNWFPSKCVISAKVPTETEMR